MAIVHPSEHSGMQPFVPISRLLETLESPDFSRQLSEAHHEFSRYGSASSAVTPAPDTTSDTNHILDSLNMIRFWIFSKYPSGEVLLSWNGGKDCTVLFHLVRLAIALQVRENLSSPSEETSPSPHADTSDRDDEEQLQQRQEDKGEISEFGPIKGMWLVPGRDVFPELRKFIMTTAAQYKLDLLFCDASAAGGEAVENILVRAPAVVVGEAEDVEQAAAEEAGVAEEGGDAAVRKKTPGKADYRRALWELKETHSFSAVLMAQRRADPGCAELDYCAPTDAHKGWPRFDRLNPLLDWSYSQVWAFLRVFQIPVCELYLQGYSSLGNSPNDTQRNPNLLGKDGKYLPAWYLHDESRERICRTPEPVILPVAASPDK